MSRSSFNAVDLLRHPWHPASSPKLQVNRNRPSLVLLASQLCGFFPSCFEVCGKKGQTDLGGNTDAFTVSLGSLVRFLTSPRLGEPTDTRSHDIACKNLAQRLAHSRHMINVSLLSPAWSLDGL